LPRGNLTPDSAINELSTREGYVVITKDADFVNSFHLHRRPHKLLLVSTGNIRNSELESLLLLNLWKLADGFDQFSFIEINRAAVIFHV
jgi:predicted nuclease of predicted toxin-antitoxin system